VHVLNKKLIGYLYFIAGILNVIGSIAYFRDKEIFWGFTYLVIAMVFITLGLIFRNRLK
jgi:hypothetical protein